MAVHRRDPEDTNPQDLESGDSRFMIAIYFEMKANTFLGHFHYQPGYIYP